MATRITLFETDLRTSIARTRWLLTGGFILLALGLMSLIYLETVSSAVHLWLTHNTYGYALAVLPIAFFLTWLRREHFRVSTPEPSFALLPLVILFAVALGVGRAKGILELQHLAFSGLMTGIIVSVIGWSNAFRFGLPLLYLFLLAPAGTPLLPMLQDVATWLATQLLAIGQIPFFAEGWLIEVATGKYEVAPGCAGLNFVLAMATMAPLYCEIMYSSWQKRLIALASMMLLVPIANGVRIFGIIAIAEYTNRAVDISADHLFYGWVFFSGVVIFVFGVGSLFADPPPPPVPIMPWGGNYTLPELLGDPIIIRVQLVLIAGFGLALSPLFVEWLALL